MDNPQSTDSQTPPADPLQPVAEMLRGDDPDDICKRHNISRAELNRRMEEFKKTGRQMALADDFAVSRVGRNDPCPCGSGKKYKKCCLPRHEEVRQFLPGEVLRKKEEKAKVQESLVKDIGKGFDLLVSKEFARAKKLASSLLATCPEDDRLHDILVSACMAMGEYDEAFRTCRRRWQVAVEEKEFYDTHDYYKREGEDRLEHVYFFSPSVWLEKFWMAQRARAYADQFPSGEDGRLKKLVAKLEVANDPERFPGRQEEGFEQRRKALEPVLEEIKEAGPAAIPHLLPLTYNFSWASLFVPDLLAACETDDSIRLLAELSMFRLPFFAQKCLENLEAMGARVIPLVEDVLERDSAFDELKVGLIMLLGHLPGAESFGILTRWIEHENPYIVDWASEAMQLHGNPEAAPYVEKARARLEELSKIGGAIRELGEDQSR
jgi:broad specificity phosphatase PhoE